MMRMEMMSVTMKDVDGDVFAFMASFSSLPFLL